MFLALQATAAGVWEEYYDESAKQKYYFNPKTQVQQ
jgi:hypothetical protein